MVLNATVKSGSIPQGEYNGVISKLEKRDYVDKDGEPFSYLDIFVDFPMRGTLKTGVPFNVSPSSKLGRLVQKFGGVLDVGTELDLEALLLHKNIKCYVQDKIVDGNTYSEINAETITLAG